MLLVNWCEDLLFLIISIILNFLILKMSHLSCYNMGVNKVKMPGVCTSNREEHTEDRFDNLLKVVKS